MEDNNEELENNKEEAKIISTEIMEIKDEDKEIIKKENSKFEWIKAHKKPVLITSIVFILFIIIFILVTINRNLITINYDRDELIGKRYTEVQEKLENRGFKNIYLEKVSDLNIEDKDNKELVTDIVVGDNSNFNSKSRFFPNKKITIVYHTLKKEVVPITSKKAKGKQYKDVVNMFKEKGYVNVKTEKIQDLITGWIKKDGEVESVKIDGKDNYSEYDSYYIDTEVIITYHTFKK